MTGRTIRNVMNTESCDDESHISAIITNDATGTDLTAAIYGMRSTSATAKRDANAASRQPTEVPRRKPPMIRDMENHTDA